MNDIIYLACPYSRGNADVRLARFNAVTHVAAKLIEQRFVVFSPITMTHPIDLVLAADGETLGSDYWVSFDESFMSFCSEIRVLAMPGWEQSSGVKREIAYFRNKGIEAVYLMPEKFGVSASSPSFSKAFQDIP